MLKSSLASKVLGAFSRISQWEIEEQVSEWPETFALPTEADYAICVDCFDHLTESEMAAVFDAYPDQAAYVRSLVGKPR